jgi:dTMP kinase
MSHGRGKLVVLEGGDAAGKSTQTKLLMARVEEGSTKVFNFPRYHLPVGKIIRKALIGDFGDFRNLNPYLSSMPYTLDRISARAEMETALSQADVICNRYTPSNVAFQAAKFDRAERKEFIEFLEKLEYEEFCIPEPDLVIFLDVPLDIALRQLESRGEEKDQHEMDIRYQEEVASVYRQLSKERNPRWVLIHCAHGGIMRTPEEIHEDVWREYQKI